MSKRRDPPVCPCGLSAETAGRSWVHHTTSCPDFIAKRQRMLVTNSSVEKGPLTSQNDETPHSPTEDDIATVVASQGLHLRIRVPLALRQPAPIPDMVPEGPEKAFAKAPSEEEVVTSASTVRVLIWRSTMPNTFGIFRKYLVQPGQPLVIPDALLPLSYRIQHSLIRSPLTVKEIISPFPNLSTFRLALWFYTGSERKSQEERTRLVNDVILAPDFSPEHFRGKNLSALDRALDQLDTQTNKSFTTTTALGFSSNDGWRSHDLTISVPIPRGRAGARSSAGINAPQSSDPKAFDRFGFSISVPGFRARSLVAIIEVHFSSPNSSATGPIHFIPYRHFFLKPGTTTEARIYDELYTGDAWLAEHRRLQLLPPVPGCKLEPVIIALMFGSDATHLTQFGQGYLWPIYLYFGNNSKWDRRKPSSRVCQHLAYIPKLSDEIKSRISAVIGGKVQPGLLAHCKREIFHACWRILLDDSFISAYENGMVVRCFDGVERRLYPRIFTYSADYPEKVLIATIKDLGTYPCTQCLVPKDKIYRLGLASDDIIRSQKRKDDDERQGLLASARQALYQLGYAVTSEHVQKGLFATSGVPTVNAFSDRLRRFEGFELYRMLVPDLLHEFELGVWKSLFSHLIRMLHTRHCQPNAVEIFDSRFRQITSFPPETIRKFRHNVSAMRKFAARDFEDVLQCCIPCFEGLFPEEDDLDIRVLIFTFGYWHALAKLRMHTPDTIGLLRQQTVVLARRLRRFAANIAPRYATTETDLEHEQRTRREVRQAVAVGRQPTASAKRQMTFNLSTIKLHGMADFSDGIEMFGTTDGYSTQITELEHRRGKAQSRRTNHGNVVEDINKYDRRETHLRRRAELLADFEKGSPLDKVDALDSEEDVVSDSQLANDDGGTTILHEREHHRISDRGRSIRLASLLRVCANDLSIQDFIPKLKDHILTRIYPTLTQFTNEQRHQIVIDSGTIMEHATIGIKFTTYDIRRAQDTINPRSKHFFVMLPNDDSNPDHPFWYAKVVGVYHINVQHHALREGALSRIDFLWVRWLELQTPGGWEVCRYDRVRYATESSLADSFGFVDPAAIIRAAHLIPAFHYGRQPDRLTEIGADDPEDNDWNSYYVNRFVDRDMAMRYLGLGPGHASVPGNVGANPMSSENAENDEDDNIDNQIWENSVDDPGDTDELEFESETDCAPSGDSDDEYDSMLEEEEDL